MGTSKNKKDFFWYCCQCGDGPTGTWNPVCSMCGRAKCHNCNTTLKSSTKFDNYFRPPVQTSSALKIGSGNIQKSSHVYQPAISVSRFVRPGDYEFEDIKGFASKDTCQISPRHLPRYPGEGSKIQLGHSPNRTFGQHSSSEQEETADEDPLFDNTNTTDTTPMTEISDSSVVRTTRLTIKDTARYLADIITGRLRFSFDAPSGIVTCTGGDVPQGSDQGQSANTPLGEASISGLKRSRQGREPDDWDSKSNDGNDNGLHQKKKRTPPIRRACQLACVFYQKDRRKCRQKFRSRACYKNGFPTIHRLR